MNYSTEEYKGYTIKIEYDDDPLSPIEDFDMLGIMICWHRKYNLGHEQPRGGLEGWLAYKIWAHLGVDNWDVYGTKYEDWEEKSQDALQLMKEFQKYNLVIPLYLYDHGGITLRAGDPFYDSWDSGQVGFVYVSHEKIKEEYGVKRLSKKILEKAEKLLKAEVEVYDNYLTGNVFGYEIEDQDENYIASCYGFFGDNGREEALEEARLSIESEIREREEEADKM